MKKPLSCARIAVAGRGKKESGRLAFVLSSLCIIPSRCSRPRLTMGLLATLSQLLPLPTSLIPQSGTDVYRLCQLSFLSFPLFVPVLRVISAPHGRFSIPSALNLNGNAAWFVMEVVSPIGFVVAFLSQPLTTASGSGSGTLVKLSELWSPSLQRLRDIPMANTVVASLFVLHYLHRAVLSPLRSPKRSPIHLSVPLSAIAFNLINGFLMGSWLGGRSPAVHLSAEMLDCSNAGWTSGLAAKMSPVTIASPGLLTSQQGQRMTPILSNPLALLALAGWAFGLVSNIYHDEVLLDLRREPHKRVTAAMRRDEEDKRKPGYDDAGKPRYGIPKGGLYKWISFPNYLSEWVEWLSYSILTFSLSRLASTNLVALSPCTVSWTTTAVLYVTSPPFLFLLAEFSAMFPRALKGHEWYHEKFGVQGDGKGGKYPRERRAVIPYLL